MQRTDKTRDGSMAEVRDTTTTCNKYGFDLFDIFNWKTHSNTHTLTHIHKRHEGNNVVDDYLWIFKKNFNGKSI